MTRLSFTTAGEHVVAVPSIVTSLHVVAVGGGGSLIPPIDLGIPPLLASAGATVTADVPVTPGVTLYAEVGVGGGAGGGGAGPILSDGGSGGGASDIRTCSAAAGSAPRSALHRIPARSLPVAEVAAAASSLASRPVNRSVSGAPEALVALEATASVNSAARAVPASLFSTPATRPVGALGAVAAAWASRARQVGPAALGPAEAEAVSLAAAGVKTHPRSAPLLLSWWHWWWRRWRLELRRSSGFQRLDGPRRSGSALGHDQLLGSHQPRRGQPLGASLAGVNLTGVNLAGANLNRANLSAEVLTGANLAGANLNRADLTAATSLGPTSLAPTSMVRTPRMPTSRWRRSQEPM